MNNIFKFLDWAYVSMGSVLGGISYLIIGEITKVALVAVMGGFLTPFGKWIFDLLRKRYERRVLAALKRLEHKIFRKNKQ